MHHVVKSISNLTDTTRTKSHRNHIITLSGVATPDLNRPSYQLQHRFPPRGQGKSETFLWTRPSYLLCTSNSVIYFWSFIYLRPINLGTTLSLTLSYVLKISKEQRPGLCPHKIVREWILKYNCIYHHIIKTMDKIDERMIIFCD